MCLSQSADLLFFHPMKIKCPACSKLLTVPDTAAGKVLKCPCGKQLRAPSVSGGATPAPGGQPAAQTPAPQAPTPQAPAQPTPNPAAPAYMQAPGQSNFVPQFPGQQYPGQKPSALGETGFAIDELTDDDFAPVKAVSQPGRAVQSTAPGTKDPLAEYVGEVEKDKQKKRAEHKEGAAKHVYSSIGILVILGFAGVAINGFYMIGLEESVKNMAGDDAEDLDMLINIIRGILILKIVIGATFLTCAATFFKFPMTSAIVSIVTFVISEIISLILNPFELISISGWIIRAAIFGGLLQAINNASYFRFVKKGGRDDEK